MTDTEEQITDAAIDKGLKELNGRFRLDPSTPNVPGSIWEQAFNLVGEEDEFDYNDHDCGYWQGKYPILDKLTAQALEKRSDQGYPDQFPKCLVFGVGAYLVSQSWTDAELQQWAEGANNSDHHGTTCITREKRAELYAQLAYKVIDRSQSAANLGDLIHIASLVKLLPLEGLKKEAEESAIELDKKTEKAALVVKLVEHMYGDVLEPAV